MLSAIWGSIMAALAVRVQPAPWMPTTALGGSGGLTGRGRRFGKELDLRGKRSAPWPGCDQFTPNNPWSLRNSQLFLSG